MEKVYRKKIKVLPIPVSILVAQLRVEKQVLHFIFTHKRIFCCYKKVSSAWIHSKVMFSYIANITCIDYLAHGMLSVNWLSASKLIPTKGRRYGLQKVLYLAYVPIAVK